MGREVKRVALDFDWPPGKVWKGYINPHYKHRRECPFCEGLGLNAETRKIHDDWYDFKLTGRRWVNNITQDEVDALVENGRLKDFTHHFVKGDGWGKNDPPTHPTAEQVNEWSQRGLGHDGINRMICVEARAKRLGVYGECEHCHGDGEVWLSKEAKAAYDAWKDYDPPAGPGWQLWENTSEGSPKSPVFETPEELAQWCETGATSFGTDTYATKEQWLKMFTNGTTDAGTMLVATNGKVGVACDVLPDLV